MQQIDLARYEDLNVGTEAPILPAAKFRVRGRGLDFPASALHLTPITPHIIDIDMPRVSMFHFEAANLNGFRLMETGGRYFHDLSLVAANITRFPGAPNVPVFEDVVGLPIARSVSERSHSTPVSGVVFCGIHEASNYGSWLFRALPKLLLTQAHAPDRPIFIHQSSGWMKRIVQLACPNVRTIPHDTTLSYRLEDVLIPSLPTPEAYLRPALQGLFTEFLEKISTHSPTPERIYLSRRDQAKKSPLLRVLENEAELVEKLSERGFVEFIPERYSFEEQISVISKAKIIVCPGGSGLFGCLFARSADLIIDLEANREWLHAHRNILDASGRNWSMALGSQPSEQEWPLGNSHRNWIVDVSAVLNGMERLGVL
jgi:hypothetical protein